MPAIRDPLNILTPFDRQTAQTGGIERMSAARSARGRFEVSVEGILLPSLYRGPGSPPLGQIKAPNFNSAFLKKQNANDLRSRWPAIDLYQMAHLWGPGFGDETPAGMMWAPQDINLDIQNSRVEAFLREYSEEAAHLGAGVHLKATAIAWDWQDNAADFLHFAEYEVSRLEGGAGYDSFSVTLEAPAPGIPGPGKFKVERQD
jgi:hypothetical protein